MTIHIAPSILAADFARLGEQVREVEQAGAQRIHIDVMDGHFVPNLSMGPEIVKCLRPVTSLPLEVHLMIEQPERYAETFIDKGADTLIVHHEVLADPRPAFAAIRSRGKKVGLAVNPENPVEAWAPYLNEIDVALCMTVHPGFAGQNFIDGSAERIKKLREMIDRINPKCDLEVDGGVNKETAKVSVQAGANVLAMASALFSAKEGAGPALRNVLAAVAPKN